MEPRISMITLGVTDLEKSTTFYEKGLGLPKIESPPGVTFFNLDGTWLSLYPRNKLAEDALMPAEASPNNAASHFPNFTLAHNVKSESQVELLFKEAVSAGAIPVKQPQKVFWGGYSSYIKDPDGFLWEIAYNPLMWIGPEPQ